MVIRLFHLQALASLDANTIFIWSKTYVEKVGYKRKLIVFMG